VRRGEADKAFALRRSEFRTNPYIQAQSTTFISKYLIGTKKGDSMAFDFVVLGATGMQGRITTRDLLEKGYSVLLCGRDRSRVQHFLNKYNRTGFRHIEATKITTITKAIKYSKANVVINCMEGDWYDQVFKACARLGVNCIDLGSEIPATKRQFSLNQIFKKKKITGITGIGSVPGIGNIMLHYASEKFDTINEIHVGFAWDSNIKEFVVPFSIESVIEEFTDRAPIVENKHFKYKVPLNTVIREYHHYIGKEDEIFVRHPEQYTFLHYFGHKGLKNIKFFAGFPDHSFKMIVSLIKLGFASRKEIDYFGTKIRPVYFLKQLLKNLRMPKGYKEKENLWVRIIGRRHGKQKVILMECLVPPLKGWESAGCNIDTGLPASILAQLIKNGAITQKGTYSPEVGVPPGLFFKELRKRHMRVYENGKVIN
jgi:saccharopine dehydrogenase-like NADP-dependent oxidoreductase